MLSKQETVTNLTQARGKELVTRARCGSLSAGDLQVFCCCWDMKVAQKMESFSRSKEFSREKEKKKKTGPSLQKTVNKEISPGISLEGMMLKLKLRYFLATSCEELTHWKRL